MKLLAVDTSSLACSVALHDGSRVFDQHEEREREHTKMLMPMIRRVLKEADLDVAGLDAIVLGNGPGSFIGMRIAASVAQGMAHGAGLPIVPVSSLAAVAAEVFAETDANEAVIAQDAHMNQVYLGAYQRGDANLPVALFAERLHDQQLIADLCQSDAAGRVAAGFGWRRYPQFATLNEAIIGSRGSVLYPRARYLLPLGAISFQNGDSIDPQDLMPAYLRNKVAEKPSRSAP
ncbi:MAG: tRNA (adenosine(37)-N6)-threonylcarbamoyltransferase complex dimerization subunit type 1 TsaB [Woeseiaceae bacterium]